MGLYLDLSRHFLLLAALVTDSAVSSTTTCDKNAFPELSEGQCKILIKTPVRNNTDLVVSGWGYECPLGLICIPASWQVYWYLGPYRMDTGGFFRSSLTTPPTYQGLGMYVKDKENTRPEGVYVSETDGRLVVLVEAPRPLTIGCKINVCKKDPSYGPATEKPSTTTTERSTTEPVVSTQAPIPTTKRRTTRSEPQTTVRPTTRPTTTVSPTTRPTTTVRPTKKPTPRPTQKPVPSAHPKPITRKHTSTTQALARFSTSSPTTHFPDNADDTVAAAAEMQTSHTVTITVSVAVTIFIVTLIALAVLYHYGFLGRSAILDLYAERLRARFSSRDPETFTPTGESEPLRTTSSPAS
ncbi:m08 protein [Murid betaherpesvirus 1]|nr:m08 protein [Murid betaherpesvirus 1]